MLRISTILLIALTTFTMNACTTVPSRFEQLPEISSNGGYIIESEDLNGFDLEVFYKSYSFTPNADDNIQEGKDYFIQVAYYLAQQRSKKIGRILKSHLRADSTRNILDGYYAINVSGRVDFVP